MEEVEVHVVQLEYGDRWTGEGLGVQKEKRVKAYQLSAVSLVMTDTGVGGSGGSSIRDGRTVWWRSGKCVQFCV